jgi:hypothetical protein
MHCAKRNQVSFAGLANISITMRYDFFLNASLLHPLFAHFSKADLILWHFLGFTPFQVVIPAFAVRLTFV